MKTYHLIQKALSTPEFFTAYYQRLFHAFDFFNIDYRFLRGYSFSPQSICLILTEKCNLKCKMCDIGQKNRQLHNVTSLLVKNIQNDSVPLTHDDWLQLIDNIALFPRKPLVLLTGTEPLLYPDILSIIHSITQKNIPLHITTNGTLLSHYAVQLTELSRKPYAIDITVSLDGIGEIHDEIRGLRGTFDKAVAGIHDISRARRHAGQSFPLVNITCTVSNYNYTHLASFVDWIMKNNLPIESITFNHLWFKDAKIVAAHNKQYGAELPVAEENIAGITTSAIDMSVVHQQIQSIKTKYKHTHIRIHQQPDISYEEMLQYYHNPCRPVFYDKCTAAWRNVTVTPQGNVILSPLCFFPSVGNVKEEAFTKIWNDGRLKKVRAQIRKAKSFPACSRCCMLFGSRPKYYKLRDWLV